MAQRRIELTLAEILEEIDWSTSIMAGKSFEQFRADRASRYVVERSIEIISEASRRIPDDLKWTRPEIDWRAIAAIGNVLRHEYHSSSAKIIWDVVREDLPLLRAAILAIAASK